MPNIADRHYIHEINSLAKRAASRPELYRNVLDRLCYLLNNIPKRYYEKCFFSLEIEGDEVLFSKPTVVKREKKWEFLLFMNIKRYSPLKWNNAVIGKLPAKNENLKEAINKTVCLKAIKNICGEVLSIYGRDIQLIEKLEREREIALYEKNKYTNI